MGLCAAALMALRPVSADDGDGDDKITCRDTAGHKRMLDELAKVALQSSVENEYLGRSELIEYRERLQQAGDGDPLDRIQLLYAIGALELRAGDNQGSIDQLTLAHELFAEFDPGAYPKLRTRVAYRLALAYLRLGETANCVERHTSASCILPFEEEAVHEDRTGSLSAIRYFNEVLEGAEPESPAELSARWLLNIAYMTLGEHPAGVPQAQLIAPEVFSAGDSFPRFEEIAPDLGLDSFNLAGGALIEDFDGDGHLDVLTSTWESRGPLHLHCSTGSGGFTDTGPDSGLNGLGGGLNMVPGDYNGDGWIDVLVLRGGWLMAGTGQQPNSLLRNDGKGSFTDVTFNAGLGGTHYPTQTASWADYDADGDLDLYIGNEATSQYRYPCELFQNDGKGAFSDVAGEAGITNLRYSKGVSWGDYDGDGWVDLYVSNLGGWNRLYHNQADGTFTDVATESGVRGPLDSFATWFWDFDNDGQLDIYVASYYQGLSGGFRLYPVVADALGLEHQAERNRLYRGDGKGSFAEVAEARGLSRLTMTMGANFGDLDNDGFLDFYLGTGYPGYDGLMPNVMFKNERGQRFADVTAAGGFGHVQKGHAIAFADLDGDGDQDVFEQMGGAYPGDAFGNVLYENPGFGNHWIKVRLMGEESNRHGLGAVIRVDVVEDGVARSIYRQVSSGGSFGGNPFQQHIGIGSAERIQRLEVFWPTTGRRQVFEDLDTDRSFLVREGEERIESTRETPRPFSR